MREVRLSQNPNPETGNCRPAAFLPCATEGGRGNQETSRESKGASKSSV